MFEERSGEALTAAQAGAGAAAEPDAEARLAAAAERIFGHRLKSAWLSGSWVYRGAQPGESDIDVVVVLDSSVPADEDSLARIRRFVEAYLEVHAREGLEPDLDFPGEYVAPETLRETLAWRGFMREGRVAEAFPPSPPKDYWPGHPGRWFNAWVSMTALSRPLAGDRGWHAARKLDAWAAIVRFLLLRAEGEALAMDELWSRLAMFGVKPRYLTLRADEGRWVERAIARLEAQGAVRREGARLVPGEARLRRWEEELASAIAREGRREGPMLLPPDLHDAVAGYARTRWRSLAPAAA